MPFIYFDTEWVYIFTCVMIAYIMLLYTMYIVCVSSGCYRESMECLIQQHTYARSPLRSYTDTEFEDTIKSHFDQSLKGIFYIFYSIYKVQLYTCIKYDWCGLAIKSIYMCYTISIMYCYRGPKIV